MLLECDEPGHGEIFVVEGRDAGNALRQIRNRRTQAVIAMQGKIPNPARPSNKTRIFKNPHIQSLQKAIEITDTKIRYARVLLLCDADADGIHARTLLMMFFSLHYPALLEQQRLFVIQPPLYKINGAGGSRRFAWSQSQLQSMQAGGGDESQISYYKGIASIQPDELQAICVNPESRTISPVTPADGAALLSSFQQSVTKS